MVSLEEFQKLDLRIAKVLAAENVEGTEKLLRLELDIGDGARRQIVAGIAQVYQPEELIGKRIVLVANLEPRVVRGIESQGMLLCANADGEPVLLLPDREVKAGVKVR